MLPNGQLELVAGSDSFARGDWTTDGVLDSPSGLAVTSDKVYISDTNNRGIRAWSKQTSPIQDRTLVKLQAPQLAAPFGLMAVQGRLYIADKNTHVSCSAAASRLTLQNTAQNGIAVQSCDKAELSLSLC
jgi:hypothetical protein